MYETQLLHDVIKFGDSFYKPITGPSLFDYPQEGYDFFTTNLTLREVSEESSGNYLCSVSELSGIVGENYAVSSLRVLTSRYQKLLTSTGVNNANSQSLLQSLSTDEVEREEISADRGFILVIAVTIGIGSLLVLTCSIMYVIVRRSDQKDTNSIKSSNPTTTSSSHQRSSLSTRQLSSARSSRVQSSNNHSRRSRSQSERKQRKIIEV